MKKTYRIFAGILLFILLVPFIYAQGEEQPPQETPQEFKDDPNAFFENPDNVANCPSCAEEYFGGAASNTNIQKNPDAAKKYISSLVGTDVDISGALGTISVDKGNVLNPPGLSLVKNLGPPVTGVTAKPGGGFTYMTSNGEVDIAAEPETPMSFEEGKFVIGEGLKANKIDPSNIGSINVGSRGRLTLTLRDGKQLRIKQGSGPIVFAGNKLTAQKNAQVNIKLPGENTLRNTKIKGLTTIDFTKGYKITGDFEHTFKSSIGSISVPSTIATGGREFAPEVQRMEDITFCNVCGLTLNTLPDKGVMWDGTDLTVNGALSASIGNGKGYKEELITTIGKKGLLYKLNNKRVDVISYTKPADVTEPTKKDKLTLLSVNIMKGNKLYGTLVRYDGKKYEYLVNKVSLVSDAVSKKSEAELAAPVSFSYNLNGETKMKIEGETLTNAKGKEIKFYTDLDMVIAGEPPKIHIKGVVTNAIIDAAPGGWVGRLAAQAALKYEEVGVLDIYTNKVGNLIMEHDADESEAIAIGVIDVKGLIASGLKGGVKDFDKTGKDQKPKIEIVQDGLNKLADNNIITEQTRNDLEGAVTTSINYLKDDPGFNKLKSVDKLRIVISKPVNGKTTVLLVIQGQPQSVTVPPQTISTRQPSGKVRSIPGDFVKAVKDANKQITFIELADVASRL